MLPGVGHVAARSHSCPALSRGIGYVEVVASLAQCCSYPLRCVCRQTDQYRVYVNVVNQLLRGHHDARRLHRHQPNGRRRRLFN